MRDVGKFNCVTCLILRSASASLQRDTSKKFCEGWMMLRGALNLAIHSPITPSEFRDLLFPNPGVRNSIRDAFSNPRYGMPAPMNKSAGLRSTGIAVSGGVDSMALAWLCSRLVEERKQLTPGRLCQFHAFIVDHKAREGSSDEARITKQRLHGMGKYKCLGLYARADPSRHQIFNSIHRMAL